MNWSDLRHVSHVNDNIVSSPYMRATHDRRVWFTTREAALAWAPYGWTNAQYSHEPLEGKRNGRKVWGVTMWRVR